MLVVYGGWRGYWWNMVWWVVKHGWDTVGGGIRWDLVGEGTGGMWLVSGIRILTELWLVMVLGSLVGYGRWLYWWDKMVVGGNWWALEPDGLWQVGA